MKGSMSKCVWILTHTTGPKMDCRVVFCRQVFRYSMTVCCRRAPVEHMQDLIYVFNGFMMLHVHQTLFQSLLTLAQLRGGAVDSEKQRHVLENLSGIFPQISSTRGINIEVNAIS